MPAGSFPYPKLSAGIFYGNIVTVYSPIRSFNPTRIIGREIALKQYFFENWLNIS
jgi:hypothetical protein